MPSYAASSSEGAATAAAAAVASADLAEAAVEAVGEAEEEEGSWALDAKVATESVRRRRRRAPVVN
jgi:hypothetical protein